MAYSVTALVRRARLPKTLRCRPTAKLCLLALADRCDEQGGGAWPSLATIAAEAEVDDVRTVRGRLQALVKHGLIYEQEPPTQHRPRVWGLNLAAIDALAPRLPLLDLDSDRQPVAPLGPPPDPPDRQMKFPDRQMKFPDRQVLAPDPVLLDPVHMIQRSSSTKSGGDVPAARAVIRELLAQPIARPDWAAMTELADRECRARGVDLGQPGDHVIARACVLESLRLKLPRADRRIVNS